MTSEIDNTVEEVVKTPNKGVESISADQAPSVGIEQEKQPKNYLDPNLFEDIKVVSQKGLMIIVSLSWFLTVQQELPYRS